ncbi:MAG: hypothetical protein COW65_14500 [Cytophagales bacterium CG18_big_fil_WC_8_21_14_2_50_42_9]|nr:MAG: hypothetical protein COW65_14500 [Cytophagales bacterium CG18_big_fil_WC_8_21_14_2_50_42_9]
MPFQSSCARAKNVDRLLLSIDKNMNLGLLVAAAVDSTYRAQEQLVERNGPRFAAAYQHLDRIIATILNSGKINILRKSGIFYKTIK